jgi:hypothetical protein
MDLPDGPHRRAAGRQKVEQHAFRGWNRVVVARGAIALKAAGPAQERSRNHAPDLVGAAKDVAGDLAHPVQLLDRNHFLVRGHLEYAVRRRVDDRRAGAHVLLAEPLNDLGAGGRAIAEDPAAYAPLELVQHLAREAVRVQGEGSFQLNTGDLPVSGGRVLARRGGRATPVARQRLGCRSQVRQRADVGDSERAQVGQLQRPAGGDVTERVAACVAVRGGVRRLTHAEAVENHQDDAAETHLA